MDEKDRPGGLTALAVINFVFAAFSIIGILGTVFSRSLISNIPMNQMTEAQAAQLGALQNMSGLTLAVIICMSVISFVLLFLLREGKPFFSSKCRVTSTMGDMQCL